MRIFTAVIVSLITIFLTAAQGAGSPEELAKEVQMLIETNQTENIDKLIQPDVDPSSISNFKEMLATYVGAENLKVYVVPKNDPEAVRKFLAESEIPGSIKPLDERAKKYEDAGKFFSITPLGDLVISGRRVGVNAKWSRSSVIYSEFNGKHVIVFARDKGR